MKKKHTKKKITKNDEIEQLKKQLARALADYDNLRKRVEREREEFGKLASVRLAIRLLPVYDMLEEAQVHLGDAGIAITIEEFTKILKDEGIEKIEVKVGDKFDEDVHEAVEVENIPVVNAGKKPAHRGPSPSGAGPGSEGKIKKVILAGWRVVDGPIIRPVKVKVVKKE